MNLVWTEGFPWKLMVPYAVVPQHFRHILDTEESGWIRRQIDRMVWSAASEPTSVWRSEAGSSFVIVAGAELSELPRVQASTFGRTSSGSKAATHGAGGNWQQQPMRSRGISAHTKAFRPTSPNSIRSIRPTHVQRKLSIPARKWRTIPVRTVAVEWLRSGIWEGPVRG